MKNRTNWLIVGGIFLCVLGITAIVFFANHSRSIAIVINPAGGMKNATSTKDASGTQQIAAVEVPLLPPLDKAAYDAKMLSIANIPIISRRTSPTSTIFVTSTAPSLWPVKNAAYPLPGAILPFNRIVAYYGNLYSTQMGVLGEYPEPLMLQKLASATAEWAAADPTTPVIPALDYIDVTAQASPGKDGKYRLRMPDSEVDKILDMAAKVNGLVFLDIQVGLSTVQTEIPLLEKYFKMPNVELALDPEFDMHNGARPGTVIGSMDAADINWAAQYLAKLVQDNNLPPKILVIHRFTDPMVTHVSQITPLPEVQIVMDMDGFGGPARKINTYQEAVMRQPIQFTGFKLFYYNDSTPSIGGHLMTPAEVLKLTPQPSYIQYE